MVNMGPDSATTIAVLQGNATVGQIMTNALKGSRFEVERLAGSPPGAARAQLVIIDVDSGLVSAERWIRHCDGRQLPVLLTGVAPSQPRFRERPWLSRPFSPDELVGVCQELLGRTRPGGDDAIPPAIEVEAAVREQPTLEVPTVGDEQPPRSTAQQATAQQSHEDLLDVLELDGTGSMILEIEDLGGGPAGGILVEVGQRRPLSEAELSSEAAANPWANEPDTAVELVDGESTAEKPTLNSSVHAIVDELGQAAEGRSEVTAVSSFRDVAAGDFSSAHRVASLVAEYWDRLGLMARPADRSERLQRIFTAMFRDGMDGVLDELKRIPDLTGFSGRIETLPVVDLLHTIRDRNLRGRLEVGLSGHSFVLYIDRSTIQAIDSLGESTDGLLLEILEEQGALSHEEARRYARQVGTLAGEPLAMTLRRDGLVEEPQLRQAQMVRARRLLARMCRGENGTFAFIEIDHQGGQSWPNRGLELNVDGLLLEIMREGSLGDARSHELVQAPMVIDSGRASSLAADALTEEERKMLNFFRDGGDLNSAREKMAGGQESVERVVKRLERLELLRQLGKSDEPADEDPADKPTAVSQSWTLEIIDDDDEATTPEAWPDPLAAGVPEETQEDVGFSAGVPDDFRQRPDTAGDDDDGHSR